MPAKRDLPVRGDATGGTSEHRWLLDPVDRISEILFGLIRILPSPASLFGAALIAAVRALGG